MNRLKRLIRFLPCLLLVLWAGCTDNDSFVVEGNVTQAEGKTLYFEQLGLNAIDVLDSAKLDQEGHFRFKIPLPVAPEFFRLRLDKRYINLASDSARTVVIVEDGKQFGKTYTVSGSYPCERIRVLSIEQGKTFRKADSLMAARRQGTLSGSDYQQALVDLFAANRAFSKKIILEDPLSPAAYFALFQKYFDYLLFDPYDKDDNICYAAVATAWDLYYKEADRTKNLVGLTLPAVRKIRRENQVPNVKVVEKDKATFYEIALPDIVGKNTTLSSLTGNVILLDFTVYQADFSPRRTFFLRELYESFYQKGFTIYQVSFDTDVHYWRTAASNLPWHCVREPRGLDSELPGTYNITQLPSFFLIDREGTIVCRDISDKELYKKIEALL